MRQEANGLWVLTDSRMYSRVEQGPVFLLLILYMNLN